MSRFRRKRTPDMPAVGSIESGAGFEDQFSDVKIVSTDTTHPPPTDRFDQDDAAVDDVRVDATEGDETSEIVTPTSSSVEEADDSGDVFAELSRAFGPDDDPTKPSGIGAPAESRTTIAIGGGDDDELPDAVYLDESIDGDPSDTVFIDDDGTGDALLPHDATGRGIEPRLRQRRIGVRRAEGRRRLKWAGVVLVVLVVVIGLLAVLGSSLFAVGSVDVAGLQRADADAVAAVVDDIEGTPTLLVDVEAAEEQLEAIPWIESARVRTDFPSSASIELRERVPVATGQGPDGAFRVFDAEGRVLDVIAGRPVAFALITNPGAADVLPGQFADTGTAAAAAMVEKLSATVRSRLVSISVVPDGSDMRLVVSNDADSQIEVRLGAAIGDNDQLERLIRLELILSDELGTATTVIDVSTDETTAR